MVFSNEIIYMFGVLVIIGMGLYYYKIQTENKMVELYLRHQQQQQQQPQQQPYQQSMSMQSQMPPPPMQRQMMPPPQEPERQQQQQQATDMSMQGSIADGLQAAF